MADQTLMIVDDSRLSRMLVKNYTLESNPDWIIIEAKDDDDALEQCQGKNIDWMTIDYNMPGMDGITLSKQLRHQYPKARIALLTANIQTSIKQQASDIDIDFIQKPITQDKIQNYFKS